MRPFLVTETENLDFVLFFIALLGCEQSFKMCFFCFFWCFCKILLVIGTWRVGRTFGHVFRHARGKSWFCIFFYSTFEPWAPDEKVAILDIFHFFFVNFMSWRACGLYLMRQCFFEAPKAKMLISYCFLSILELSARLEKVFVLDIFQFLLWNLCLGVHVACIRCVNAFSNIKTNIFILYCFLQNFWAVGTSRKGDLFRRFPDFFLSLHTKILFLPFDFTALLRRGHSLKMFFFLLFL